MPTVGAPVWGPVVGLPDPQPGVVLLVSTLVLGHVVGRTDVMAPATGPTDDAIREGGQVVAVTRLVRA